ncbi:MAG: hypothetical protein ACLFPQ_04870 [Candidatus Woesearchaeota archaeon]
MKNDTLLIIIALAVSFVLVGGIMAVETMAQSETASSVSGDVVSYPINSREPSIRRDLQVLAAEHRMDREEIVVREGQEINIEVVTTKDSYLTLEGIDDFEIKESSPSVINFKADEKGEYVLGCSFKCKQADLARELKIIVE